jgi:uncharacterized membrane protein
MIMQTLKSFRPVKYADSGTIHEWLLASSCFSCLLLAGRMIATGTIEYIFLPWNLFLAFVPYWITWWMLRNISLVENRIKRFIALAAWLLFIPNSFYIITDLFHFRHVRTAPQWFDLLLIFSFSWNGILGGIVSLRRVEIVIEILGGRPFSVLLVGVVMWLSAFGIYIGRYLRYNSWDVVTDPFSLAGEIMNMIFHPLQNGYAWGMTLLYSVFMTFLYFTIKKIGAVIYFNKPV